MTNEQWKATVRASIGASIAQSRQRNHATAGSWWLDTPRDQWMVNVYKHAPRMNRSRFARLVVGQTAEWPA